MKKKTQECLNNIRIRFPTYENECYAKRTRILRTMSSTMCLMGGKRQSKGFVTMHKGHCLRRVFVNMHRRALFKTSFCKHAQKGQLKQELCNCFFAEAKNFIKGFNVHPWPSIIKQKWQIQRKVIQQQLKNSTRAYIK